jgi:hypothetical protein
MRNVRRAGEHRHDTLHDAAKRLVSEARVASTASPA